MCIHVCVFNHILYVSDIIPVHNSVTVKQFVSSTFYVNLLISSLMFSLQIVLKPLLDIALNISQLEKFTGRNAPTVIT